MQEGGGKFEEDSSAGFIGILVAAVAEDHDAELPTWHHPDPRGRNRSASPLSSQAQSLFLRHLVVAQRDRPAALGSFDPACVSSGSFTTDAGEATRACLSAFARKRTNGPTSWGVRFVPLAAQCSAANCRSDSGCIRTLWFERPGRRPSEKRAEVAVI